MIGRRLLSLSFLGIILIPEFLNWFGQQSSLKMALIIYMIMINPVTGSSLSILGYMRFFNLDVFDLINYLFR